MKLFARMPDPLYVGGKKTRAISDPAFSALLTFYRTLEAFTDLIYLTVGDVNIPEQIPARFRTI
jgi:hypothetical protein